MRSLQLSDTPLKDAKQPSIQRLNRLPIILVVSLVVAFFAIIIYSLASRGLRFHDDRGIDTASNSSASPYADQMKRGISNGIIGEPDQDILLPAPILPKAPEPVEKEPVTPAAPTIHTQSRIKDEDDWLAGLKREENEQYLRELHRQKLARLQAKNTAFDSPLAVDIRTSAPATPQPNTAIGQEATVRHHPSMPDVQAIQPHFEAQDPDFNDQSGKSAFINQNIKKNGYLSNRVSPRSSPFELKKGSVIPATLITGINSDLPGRIIAQVSRHIFDSATGHELLIPQGTRLFGRYDSSLSFNQSRVLVVWTDIIFPDGSTLQIDGMAGTDTEGYGGFSDKINRHSLRTFGSAALLALIGTGIDMAALESSTAVTQNTATDAARRNFAETFGRVVERSIDKNMRVQPTLDIRPGYQFNVLVDQDIVFPSRYHG
jgi:type IV secretion system protein TrbI